jgi:hypothetical protein
MSVATLSLALQSQIGSGPDLAQKGAWVIDTAYVANDVVTRTGNTYICTLASTGDDPVTDAQAHWTIIRTGITSTALTALSDALVSGFAAMSATRLSRRIGLLNAVVTPAALPCNVRVDDIARSWNECAESEQYRNAALGNDQNLSAFRAIDPAVRASLTSGYTSAQLQTTANLLIDSASDYAALVAETLPA